MTDHIQDNAMRTCNRDALARSYHIPQAPLFTVIDVLGVMLKPYTIISLGLLFAVGWVACGMPGVK